MGKVMWWGRPMTWGGKENLNKRHHKKEKHFFKTTMIKFLFFFFRQCFLVLRVGGGAIYPNNTKMTEKVNRSGSKILMENSKKKFKKQ